MLLIVRILRVIAALVVVRGCRITTPTEIYRGSVVSILPFFGVAPLAKNRVAGISPISTTSDQKFHKGSSLRVSKP